MSELVGPFSNIMCNTPEVFSITELKRRLQKLKNLSPLAILGPDKKRNSAVGESLERYLGLVNNSSPDPDWGEYEIKTSKSGSHKLSMFAVKWNFPDGYNLRNLAFDFGKNHISRHLNEPVQRLDWAIPYSKQSSPRLYLLIEEDDEIFLKSDNKVIASMSINNLKKRFFRKYGSL